MKNEHLPEDEKFMAQFANRLNVEPPPKWATERKREWPWLEIGWAAAATLLLGTYWTELRFGATTLSTAIVEYASLVPLQWLVMGAGLVYIAGTWLAPKIVQELR